MSKVVHYSDARTDLPFFVHSEIDDYGLDPYEFRVYGRIARRAGRKSECTESIPNIARGCKMSERKVRYALAVLVAAKFVSESYETGGTKHYQLLPKTAWVSATSFDQVRERALTTNPSKRPQHKTPAHDAAPPPLHMMQPPPAHDAAKGSPSKVLPDDVSRAREKTADQEQPKTQDPYMLMRSLKGYELICFKNALGNPRGFEAVISIVNTSKSLFSELCMLRQKSRDGQKSADVVAWQMWLCDVVDHLERYGLERVRECLKTTLEHGNLTSPWGFYRSLITTEPKAATPVPGQMSSAPAAPMLEYGDHVLCQDAKVRKVESVSSNGWVVFADGGQERIERVAPADERMAA